MHARSIFAFLLCAAIVVLQSLALADDRPLTNADIVTLAHSFSDQTLITIIKTHKDAFDVSPDALVALRRAGVPDDVVRAMVEVSAPPAQPNAASGNGSTAPSLPAGPTMSPQVQAMMQSMGMTLPGMQSTDSQKLPDVWIVRGSEKTALKASTATSVQNQMQGAGATGSSMLGSVARSGLGMAGMALGPIGAIAGSLVGMFSRPKVQKPHMHLVWALPGPAAQTVLQTATPSFEVRDADIPGINPDSFESAIVKLEPTKDNWRLVGATDQEISAMNFMGGAPPADSIVENRVDAIIRQIGPGDVQITPEKPLDAGQYGLVLRPDAEADKSHDAGGPAANQLFYTVWDFAIAGTPAPPAPAATPH